METADKLMTLAFNAAATEGEAVAAFLALRRIGGPKNTVETIYRDRPSNKVTMKWDIKLGPKMFDAFFSAVQDWHPDEPFVIIKKNEPRKNLLDQWDIELTAVLHDRDDANKFNKYLDVIFEELKYA